MTASKQDIEVNALIGAFATQLQASGFGTLPFQNGFELDEQIANPFISVYFLPSGPEPFQIGDTIQKYYRRVMQVDAYMDTKGKALALSDNLMDYIDIMVVPVADPLSGNAIVGSITCQNTDSIYAQLGTPNFEHPKLIRWRGIVRATLDCYYPNG